MQGKKLPFFRSLSSQLLVLTILFVMIIQVFVYVPSLAQFRKNYLDQRLVAAQIAALSLEEAVGLEVSPMLEQELLESAEIQAVIVIREDSRQLILRSELPASLSGDYDLRDPSLMELIGDAFATLKRGGVGSIQVAGSPINTRHQSVVIILEEGPLYTAMVKYSRTILGTTFILSLFTAALIFVTIMFLMVRPTKRITRNLTAFAKNPEAAKNTLKASGRKDEIGLLEDQIARMQGNIRQALRQKTHLANLGMAVSKINHDLRNILSTTRLSADTLKRHPGEGRQEQTFSRFLRSVDRAVALCERTLKYGRADEPAPERRPIDLKKMIEEAEDTLKDSTGGDIKWVLEIPKGLKVNADPEQLFRAFFNLCRNALEAMGGKGTLTLSAKRDGDTHMIAVADTGPGIPDEIRDTLFVPFAGSTKGDGSGLGLAIAQELIRAHGGEIILEKSDKSGSVFCICLPAPKP